MHLANALTSAQQAVLHDLAVRDASERAAGIRDDSSLKALNPDVARFLYFLVRQSGARTIVEFGTSHGYSTIHLAAAAEANEGHVWSVDLLREKTDRASANLERAGLSHRVTLVTCDGADFASNLPAGIDFVLVDYGIPAFLPAFPVLRPGLAPGCLIFFDGGPDTYWESDGIREFRTQLEEDDAFLVTLLPMHKVQLLATYSPVSGS